MRWPTILAGALLLWGAVPASVSAQDRSSLNDFVGRVAQLWERGDASALVELSAGERILLDLGETSGTAEPRHAAAMLRSLFSERESVSARARGASTAGGNPPRGFGEVEWLSRGRGVSSPRRHTIYVGAVWRGGWKIQELRLLGSG
ncbi:MAG: hypothetical protein ACREKN_03675 [Longimicrobiaceae bacterium]